MYDPKALDRFERLAKAQGAVEGLKRVKARLDALPKRGWFGDRVDRLDILSALSAELDALVSESRRP